MHKPQNYINQLAKYILKNLKKGYTLDSLRFSLINQGYSKISVDNAIEVANKKLAETAPVMKEKPQISYKVVDDKEVPVKVEKKKGWFRGVFG